MLVAALRFRNHRWEDIISLSRLGQAISFDYTNSHPARPSFLSNSLPWKPSFASSLPSQSSTRGEATTTDKVFHGRFSQTVRGGHTVQLNVTGQSDSTFEISKQVHLDSESRPELKHQSFVQSATQRVQQAFKSTFLPAGFPQSVGPNYINFTTWQFLSSIAVTANSVLASTFLLYSVGLGSGAIATAGALNWVLKDGIGQLGTLVFGKTIAHNFDIHSKTWYIFSMVMMNLAIGVELLTILCPHYFLFMGSFANSVKGLAIMASGSTRSVFNLSFVRDNNIADITAKGTSQYIFASLLGTALGAGLASYIQMNFGLAFIALNVLGFSTMIAAFYTVKSIPLCTLNNIRLQLLGEVFLTNLSKATEDQRFALVSAAALEGQAPATEDWRREVPHYQHDYDHKYDESVTTEIPTPVQFAADDPPLPWLMGDRRMLNPAIRVGHSLDRLLNGNAPLLAMMLTTFKYSNYMVLPCDVAIHVILHNKAKGDDIIQAFLQACILRTWLRAGGTISHARLHELRIVLQDTQLVAQRLTPTFIQVLEEHGWHLQKIIVEGERRRAYW